MGTGFVSNGASREAAREAWSVTSEAIAALGFAPHSGWAVVIGVTEVDAHLRVLVRERIEIADPRHPGSRQPYHAVAGLPIGEAAERLVTYAATAELMAHEAVQRIDEQLSRDDHRAIGVGILESAGRKGSALADILKSHAQIHTADGDHFRNAIAAAATRCGLATSRVRARELDAKAAAAIGKPIETLHRAIKEVGRGLGPPWRADHKAAALLAWLVLTEGPRTRR